MVEVGGGRYQGLLFASHGMAPGAAHRMSEMVEDHLELNSRYYGSEEDLMGQNIRYGDLEVDPKEQSTRCFGLVVVL